MTIAEALPAVAYVLLSGLTGLFFYFVWKAFRK